jgi:hypothetical protein
MRINVQTATEVTSVYRTGRGGSAIPSFLPTLGLLDIETAATFAVLPTALQEYAWRFGFTTSNSNLNNAAYVQLALVAGVLRWQLITTNAGTPTTITSTSIAIAAATHYRVHVVFDTGSISAYINGVLLGTSVANLPTGAMFTFYQIAKLVGNTSVNADHDYYWERQTLATPYV